MITETKNTKKKISERTTKEYYVIMDDCVPVGVCTERDADACLGAYAEKKNAIMCSNCWRVFLYGDSSGEHCITLRKVPRMKMSR